MGLTNKIGRIAGRGFLKGVFKPILGPVAAVFTSLTFVPVLIAVSFLWGMTTKPPENQSWSLSDYLVVVPLSWAVARNGRILGGAL